MKNKKQPKAVDFEFRIGPMEEALQLSSAGGAKYEGLAMKLITELPELVSNGQTIFFKYPGKEMAENERRGVCISLTSALKRAGLPYRITYSTSTEQFLAVPRRNKLALFKKTIKLRPAPRPTQGSSMTAQRKQNSDGILRWLTPLACKVLDDPAKVPQDCQIATRRAIIRVAMLRGVRIKDLADHFKRSATSIKSSKASSAGQVETKVLLKAAAEETK